MSDKLDRKKLKAPDVFQIKVMKALSYLMQRKNIVLGTLGVLVLVVVAIAGAKLFFVSQSNDRRLALTKIDEVYTEEVKKASEQKEGFDKKLGEIQTNLAKTDIKPEEKQKLEGEKTKLEAEIEAIQPKHDESAKRYLDFYKKYPKAPEGWAAGLRYVGSNLKAGDKSKGEENLKIVKEIVDNSKESTLYQTQGRLMIVNSLEDLGKYDEALQETETFLKNAPDAIKPRLLLTKGRIQAEKKMKDEANKTFDVVIKDHANTPEAQKAKAYKTLIN
ncbi:MAG: tol-pal system YbgF family protein [Oligoflexales bacterium]